LCPHVPEAVLAKAACRGDRLRHVGFQVSKRPTKNGKPPTARVADFGMLCGVQAIPNAQRRVWRVTLAGPVAVLALTLLPAGPVEATPPPFAPPVEFEASTNRAAGAPGILGDMLRRNYVLGDMWGLRERLGAYGISF